MTPMTGAVFGQLPRRAAMLVGNSSVAIRRDFAGPAPAGNNELTDTKIHHGITSRCHFPLCWAGRAKDQVSQDVSP